MITHADKRLNDINKPPFSNEAEQAVLGGLLLDQDAWDKVCTLLSEADFHRKSHRIIFRMIEGLIAKSYPLDILTLVEQLKAHGELENVGGEVYLFELAKNTPSAANIEVYAEIVRERSVLRQLISIGNSIVETAYDHKGVPISQLVDNAEGEIFAISEHSKQGDGPESLNAALAKAVDKIDGLSQVKGSVTGLPTGFNELDKMTSGLQEGELIIIAGRPSMGKTSFAMNIVEKTALSDDRPVLVFSMEMSSSSLATRMISSLGGVDQHRLRTGDLTEDDWARVQAGMNMVSQATVLIDDKGGLSPAEVRARARRVIKEHGPLSLIVVDYLQLMHVPGAGQNRTLEVSEISRSLKNLAKELNVPLIALSQLNRSLEQRADKRPIMSDLRESGSIEQDADLIMFIYRDEVYHEESPDRGTAEIIISKQRNGPIGKVRLTFQDKYTRFDNLYYGGVAPEIE